LRSYALKSSGTDSGVASSSCHQKDFIGVSMDKTVTGVDFCFINQRSFLDEFERTHTAKSASNS